VTSGLGCGDGAPCLAWGPGCEFGDMPPVLGIPLRLGRPRPPTHFRPQPELAPRAKGPLLSIEIENPAINCHEFGILYFTRFRAAAHGAWGWRGGSAGAGVGALDAGAGVGALDVADCRPVGCDWRAFFSRRRAA